MPDSLPDAVSLGSVDGAVNFGLTKEAWARLIGTGLGALAGSALADRDERVQGAVLGGLGGYMGGEGLSRLGGMAKNVVQSTPIQRAVLGQGGPKQQGLLDAAAHYGTVRSRNGKLPPVAANGPSLPNFFSRAGDWLKSKFGSEKSADVNVGMGVPGTPFSISARARDERLPGMHRWVPREMIERAHLGLDLGLDPADVIEMERDRGRFLHPAVGAGIGAALTRFGMGGRNMGTVGMGALMGAGAGAAYNQFSAPIRAADASEALAGVTRERGFPLHGQQAATAVEATPMVTTSGGGVV